MIRPGAFILFLLWVYPALAAGTDSLQNRLTFLRVLHDRAKRPADRPAMAACSRDAGRTLMLLNRPAEALVDLLESYSLDSLLGRPTDPVTAEWIGSCYRLTGRSREAADWYQRAVNIYQERNIAPKRHGHLFYLALIYADWGWDEKALYYYNETLKVQLALHDSLYAGYTLANMGGICHKSLGRGKGIEYYRRATQIFLKLKNAQGLGYVDNALGSWYLENAQFDSATACFKRALAAYGTTYTEGSSFAWGNLGDAQFGQGRSADALVSFDRALQAAEQCGSVLAECSARVSLAKVYRKNGETGRARKELLIATDKARAIGFRSCLSDCYKELTDLYKTSGDFSESLKYSLLYSSIHDSIFRENSQHAIAETEARYAAESREQQILLLKKENDLSRIRIETGTRLMVLSVAASLVLLALVVLLARFYVLKTRAYNNYVKLTVDQLRREQQAALPPEPEPKPEVASEGFEHSPETADLNRRLGAEFARLMASEKLYLNPGLTLHDVAQALNTNTTYLSRAVNDTFGRNFSTYLNELRIREAQIMLSGPGYAHLSIEGIALSAGFNSKSAFHAAFKKHTGVTPSFFQRSAERRDLEGEQGDKHS